MTTVKPQPESGAKLASGMPAFRMREDEEYLKLLLTNTLGQTMTQTKEEVVSEARQMHEKMVSSDPEFVARALRVVRERGYMRTQPIFGLATLMQSPHKPGVDKQAAFAGVIKTPKDLADFETITKSINEHERNYQKAKWDAKKGAVEHIPVTVTAGSEGGRSVKTVAGEWLSKNFRDSNPNGEFWALKYGSDSQEQEGGFSLKSMFRTYHPDYKGEDHQLVRYVVDNPKRPADLTNFPKLAAYEKLKAATTDKEKAQAIREGNLPLEVCTPFIGNSKECWEALAPMLPPLALLKNLATLERHGVLEGQRPRVEKLFSDPERIKRARILPFRFVEAEKHAPKKAWVTDALRGAAELSLEGIPEIEGRAAVLLDVSPSMRPPYSQRMDTAAPFAIALAKKLKDGKLIIWDTDAAEFPVSMKDSMLGQAALLATKSLLSGTNPSIALDFLEKTKDYRETLVVITDGEQNSGMNFAQRLMLYRRNAFDAGVERVRVFIVDLSDRKNALVPSDSDTFAIHGWSDQMLQFISLAAQGFDTMADAIRAGAI